MSRHRYHYPVPCLGCGSLEFVKDMYNGITYCDICGLIRSNESFDESGAFFHGTSEDDLPIRGYECEIEAKTKEDHFFVTGDTILAPIGRKRARISALDRMTKEVSECLRTDLQILGLGESIRLLASQIINSIEDIRLVHKSMEANVAAIIYEACQLKHEPVPVRGICASLNIPKKKFGKSLIFVKRMSKIEDIIVSQPKDFIEGFSKKMPIPIQVTSIACEIATSLMSQPGQRHQAPTIAVSAIMFSAIVCMKNPPSLKEFAVACSLPADSIKRHYKSLLDDACQVWNDSELKTKYNGPDFVIDEGVMCKPARSTVFVQATKMYPDETSLGSTIKVEECMKECMP